MASYVVRRDLASVRGRLKGKGRDWVLATASALLLLLSLGSPRAVAQAPSGTLTGTVLDQSGGVIPDANVVLKSEDSGAIRRTASNKEGFFTIVAIPAGTYTVTIEVRGFAPWEETGIVFHQGDVIKLRDISLKVASGGERVTVEGTPPLIAVDSGEKSEVITSNEIQNLSIVGRNAVELLKILPGVVNSGGQTGGVQFNGQFTMFTTVGGAVGSYNIAGTRSETMDINSDGANVIDPGCNCGAAVTPNVDMVQEVKVQVANFSADSSRGPTVFQTVTKAGTSAFHGEGYFSARNNIFNSQDWLANRFQLPKPNDSYYYPGFNIGGPVLIPGSDFNRKRNKLFFFFGAEWMRQNVDLGVHSATVPTAKMRTGDFSELANGYKLNGYDVSQLPSSSASSQAAFNCCGPPIPLNGISSQGVIDPSLIDPGGKILLNLYPLPNRDPNTNSGFNYVSDIVNPQNRTQQRLRLDYNISDNTKLYTAFNHEDETFPFPYITWWSQPTSVPYPTLVIGDNRSYSTSTSLVNVFNPTLTNEVVFAATYLNLPNHFADRTKVSRKALGYPYKGVFGQTSDLIPNVSDWGGGVADSITPGGFDPVLFANKWIINTGDNLTKVQGTHSLKFGVYYQLTTNVQPSFNDNQGDAQPSNWGGTSTGNAFADLLLGRLAAYDEYTTNPVGHGHTHEFAFYAQDNWKATKRLTLEYGARFYHIGQMSDTQGHYAGFDISKYNPSAPITAYSGVVAPYRGDNVPGSIFPADTLHVGPRLGFAYDITGRGNTVIRGGAGEFLYRDVGNITENSVANPPLVQSVNFSFAPPTLAQLDQVNPAQNVPVPSLSVLDPHDHHISTTDSWSLTLSQRVPSQTVVDVSYVGNTSRHQMTQEQRNINVVPEGAMFGFPMGTDPNSYRPFKNYGPIVFYSHALSQNYNALQVTAKRWTGRINYSLAYTFSKTLGVGGNYKGFNGEVDPFDPRGRSYGPLPYDRTHILSLAYNIDVPGPKRNPLGKQVLNGWQLSGISQFQSGGPLVQGTSTLSIGGTMANGQPISAINIAGTPDTSIHPILTCDPRNGLGPNQFANPSCFAAPQPGKNGNYQTPYIKQPGSMSHDISLFKNFPLTAEHEERKIQFRAAAYNFLNHPISFFQTGDPGLGLNYKNGVLTQSSLQDFGIPVKKQGNRVLEMTLKLFF
jgi:Carboxypeptidase regulatory-like domain